MRSNTTRGESRVPDAQVGWVAVALALLWTVTAPPAAAVGDPVAGRQKAAICTSCHGPDGNSQFSQYPKLAGQLPGYIVKETMDFRTGARTDQIGAVGP